MIVRFPVLAGAGNEPFLFGQVLQDEPPPVGRRLGVDQAEARQGAHHMLVMLRHQLRHRLEPDSPFVKPDIEGMVLGMPGLPQSDDFGRRPIADGIGFAVHDRLPCRSVNFKGDSQAAPAVQPGAAGQSGSDVGV